jgi:transcriptional regulator with XRE-family HTH domain
MLSIRPVWAKKILSLMHDQGKNQAYMAKKINVSESTFNKMVNGKAASPSIDESCTMCNDLGVTLDNIFLE